MILRYLKFSILWCLGVALGTKVFAFGYTSDRFGGQLGERILLADCQWPELSQDSVEGIETLYTMRVPLLCLRPRIELEYAGLSRSKKDPGFESRRLRSYAYAGVFLPWRFSLHVAGSVQETLSNNQAGWKVVQKQETERFFLQWGRTSIDVWTIRVGRMYGLFGLNDLVYPYIQKSLYNEPEKFFEHDSYGWTLIRDTLQSEMYEISILSTRPEFFRKDSEETIVDDGEEVVLSSSHSALFRSSFDVGVFEGLRMVYSVLGGSDGSKRFGAGLMIDSGSSNRASLEWVRDYSGVSADAEYTQMIDFTVRNSQSKRIQTIFSIQSIRNEYLRVEIGLRNTVPNAGFFDLSLDYFNFRDDTLGEALSVSLGATTQI